MSVTVFFFTGTYITQDHESFSQSFTKQSDPFGKQLVQMFTEMLTHNHKVEEEVFQLQLREFDLLRDIYSLVLIGTHVFIGSVGPDQRTIQTRLHIVDLLIILWEYNNHLNRRDLNNQSLFFMNDCAPVMPNTRTLQKHLKMCSLK